jgi:hypothetical protein
LVLGAGSFSVVCFALAGAVRAFPVFPAARVGLRTLVASDFDAGRVPFAPVTARARAEPLAGTGDACSPDRAIATSSVPR